MGGNSSAPPPLPITPELLKMSQTSPFQAAALGTPEASLINPQTGALNFNMYTGKLLGGPKPDPKKPQLTDSASTQGITRNPPQKPTRLLGGLGKFDEEEMS